MAAPVVLFKNIATLFKNRLQLLFYHCWKQTFC